MKNLGYIPEQPVFKRTSLKYKFILVALLSFIMGVLIDGRINWFRENYQFKTQSPIDLKIDLKAPIYLQKRLENTRVEPSSSPSALPLPEPSEEATSSTQPLYFQPPRQGVDAEVISKKKHALILWTIYGLESTWGKNDGCRSKGLINGFGFAQSTFSWICYRTFEEVASLVDTWFDRHFAEGMDLATATCYYNTGKRLSDCPYYRKFLSLQ